MAAIGFTWVYLIIIAMIAGPEGLGTLSADRVQQLMSLGYLAIILPLIGSGLAITVQSWAAFWQRRDFGNAAIAAWNTYAQINNLVGAVREVPSALSTAKDLLFGDDDEETDASGNLVVLLAALAIGAGIITTTIIVSTVAARVERELAFRAAARD